MTHASSQDTHIGNIRLTDLAFASRFSIWWFRAVATGHHRCPAVIAGYRQALNEQAESAYQALQDFVCLMAQSGRRSIKISLPGCLKVTADELSILSAIHAVQTDQYLLVKSHLNWLLGSHSDPVVFHAVTSFGSALAEGGVTVPIPDIQLQSARSNTSNIIQSVTQQGDSNVRTLH